MFTNKIERLIMYGFGGLETATARLRTNQDSVFYATGDSRRVLCGPQVGHTVEARV